MNARTFLTLRIACLITGAFSGAGLSAADALPVVSNVEGQPLVAHVRRLIEAMDLTGAPIGKTDKAALEQAFASNNPAEAIQRILDPYCLVGVTINPESRVKVASGPARAVLVEQGWRQFLVKVQNEAGATAELRAVSPNALALYEGGFGANSPSDKLYRRNRTFSPAELWLDLALFNRQPLRKELSGLNLEYVLLQLYSRDAGKREAKIAFDIGQGTQDLGYRNEVDLTFECLPAREVTLKIRDEKNQPTTASLVIKDQQGRVYPSQAKRLAPDFGFHPQIYRADGEKLRLPEGSYTVEFSRGPESVPKVEVREVKERNAPFSFQVERWVDPSRFGYWSGDHHIHAAGCAHYTKPTEGVHAPDMMRHCLGEDLKVGANLTWGPCFDYQKQFFTGSIDKVSKYPYLLRYDVEVSGFGSHQSGHLCLLRLKDQMYPGGTSKDHWPTLCLNTLRWAKAQGAVTGPAHSGWGLETDSTDLPNYVVPPFNGIGANEYIVDVTHNVPGPGGQLVPAVDFISTVDTPYVWELNIWYHTLNAGFRTRISGETDFPCIYGERVGLGRSYVKLPSELDYDAWCDGIRKGANYVSDGKSHLFNFKVGDAVLGEKGSELRLDRPGSVKVRLQAVARLSEAPDPSIKAKPYQQKPFWHIERARIGESREVPVELVVNGRPVAQKNLLADGTMRDLEFDVEIPRSSWIAVRVLPSSHTNPIFVLVDGKPIRPSRRSVEWCLKGVDQCWSQKERFIRENEKEQALAAYDHARATYRKILAESEVE